MATIPTEADMQDAMAEYYEQFPDEREEDECKAAFPILAAIVELQQDAEMIQALREEDLRDEPKDARLVELGYVDDDVYHRAKTIEDNMTDLISFAYQHELLPEFLGGRWELTDTTTFYDGQAQHAGFKRPSNDADAEVMIFTRRPRRLAVARPVRVKPRKPPPWEKLLSGIDWDNQAVIMTGMPLCVMAERHDKQVCNLLDRYQLKAWDVPTYLGDQHALLLAGYAENGHEYPAFHELTWLCDARPEFIIELYHKIDKVPPPIMRLATDVQFEYQGPQDPRKKLAAYNEFLRSKN